MCTCNSALYQLGRDIAQILFNQESMMTAFEDLTAEVSRLADIVAADQVADAATVVALKDQIAVLEGKVAAGLSPEDVVATIAALQAIEAGVTPA